MRVLLRIIFITFCTFHTMIDATELSQGYQAMVIVPIADLVGQPFGRAHNEKMYQQLPVCGKSGPFACPRINQLLFHEIVTVVDQKHDEVQVSIPHMYFQTAHSPKKHTTYWTLKKNIVPLETLTHQAIPTHRLPQPLSYEHRARTEQPIATLTLGHYDPITRLHFSAGTRFVIDTTQRTKQNVPVWVYSPRTHSIKKTTLPLSHVLISSTRDNPQQQRKNMVATARTWAHHSKGIIPYVWGGCSLTTPCSDATFSEQHGRDAFSNKPITYYTRSLHTTTPVNGFDCTGLVIRAAQIAGIPYFYKNTTTITKNLQPITDASRIQPGDLIWIPGHIIMIADTHKNTVIEAVGYQSGYGRIHEIPLHQMFKNINTFNDLIRAYNENKPLQRLNNKGGVISTIKTFKVVSLDPVWA